MVNNPPDPSILNQVAWPLDVLYDIQNKFCGFVMSELNINAELKDVYQYPPTAGLSARNKVVIAENICAVISAVHNAGYVFGDFNPRNIGVDKNSGKVAFLDTDSYHVFDNTQNKHYRCKVCADGYAAPELLEACSNHAASYPNDSKQLYEKTPLPTFTKETDNFALAIHIFKLLMNGFTPFGGIIETVTPSRSSPSMGNAAIRRNEYSFRPGYKPLSPAVPPLDIFPREIADLFMRAFLVIGSVNPSQRPTAIEWYHALSRYETMLIDCTKNRLHQYDGKNKVCPFCEADMRYQSSISGNKIQTYTPSPAPISPIQQKTYPSSSPAHASVTRNTGVPLKTTKKKSHKLSLFSVITVIATSLSVIILGVVLINTRSAPPQGTPDTRWYTRNPNALTFTISTADELAGLAEIVNGTAAGITRNNFSGRTITLSANIDLSNYTEGEGWVPISNFPNITNAFSGTFDGGGFVISNLVIYRPDTDIQGLFGIIHDGWLENIRLDGMNIIANNFVGGVVGLVSNNSSVTYSHSTGAISGNNFVGGVVGSLHNSSVTNNHSSGTVSGNDFVGGIVGSSSDNSSVANNHSRSGISGNNVIGGIAGSSSDNSSVVNSYSSGVVSGSDFVGGVVGVVSNNSSVTNNPSNGTVSGNYSVGGVVGVVSNNSSVTHSHSTGAISGSNFVGGIVGFSSNNNNVANSHSSGKVRGNNDVGGVVGLVINDSTVTDSHSNGIVNGGSRVGGVVGSAANNSTVTNNFSTSEVSGIGCCIGGVVGRLSNSRATNNAALNPRVNGSSPTNRIVGAFETGTTYTVSGNVAFSGMINIDNNATWFNVGTANFGGADISAASIRSDGTIGGRFTNENGWTTQNGSLPGIDGLVAIPQHLQGSD